ncbi:hypothetical protein BLNAU_24588 [Blattamonas nauphoetae]|uniref:Uncharacterized protein n=1 Tax=Blattamonas nauphoetae TaxID=2049346 RepID=A0ABQ9WM04_9EUKA|nr:hypothetical protein BLNAU_24588 [Blattamonas nauphoetae]
MSEDKSIRCVSTVETCKHILLGTGEDVSDVDVKLVMEGMKTNPLMPWWRRQHIIPFVTDTSGNCEELVKQLSKPDKKLKRKDREICITVLLIHAPIEESEKVDLITLIKTCPKLKDHRKALTSLIKQNVLSQKKVDEWNNALSCLEEIETLNGSEKKKALDELPRSVLIYYLQKPRGMCEDKSTILPLIEQAPLSKKVKDTLLSLVDGKPRFTSSRRKEIASLCCPGIQSKLEDSLVESIHNSGLSEKKKTDLEHYVRAHESVGGKEIKRLMKLIKKDEDLKQKSNDLSSFLGRSKIMYKSDQSLALLCCLTQIIVTEDALNDLFRHLRGESLDKTLIESIRTEIERFRERLHDKQMHLFKRLKGAKLSWKDLAALLCLPNGGESTSLPGLKVLFPPPPPKPKKIKLRHVHQTPQKGSKVYNQIGGGPYIPSSTSVSQVMKRLGLDSTPVPKRKRENSPTHRQERSPKESH